MVVYTSFQKDKKDDFIVLLIFAFRLHAKAEVAMQAG